MKNNHTSSMKEFCLPRYFHSMSIKKRDSIRNYATHKKELDNENVAN